MNYYSILEINYNHILFCKLNDDVIKSPIFNSQWLALHQNGVEFSQLTIIGDIRFRLATLWDMCEVSDVTQKVN